VDKNAQLAATNNGLCTQCHRDIGERAAAHAKHRANSAESACVACTKRPQERLRALSRAPP
jgi:hypothetical protein